MLNKFDIWRANLNPQRGTEVGKIRPVLIIQVDLINTTHHSTIILPITTNVISDTSFLRVNILKGEAGLEQDSAIIMDQLRAIDNKNFIQKLGTLPNKYHAKINHNLKIVLDLD